MISIGIYENNKDTLEYIEFIINKIAYEQVLMLKVTKFHSDNFTNEFLFFENNLDIFIIGLETENLIGIKLGKWISLHGIQCIIIFLYRQEKLISRMMEIEPFRILKKPLDEKSL